VTPRNKTKLARYVVVETVYSMQRDTPDIRPNLSGTTAITLRAMIIDGVLRPGDRINEVHLGAKLGVSRTPLREALMHLEAEGAVTSKPRFGFYVCPLSIEEFEQIYAMRALLDPEALRLSGLPTKKQLTRLRALNDSLRKGTDPSTLIDRDNAWHRELVSACPNRLLIGLIGQFIEKAHRYELALMRERSSIDRTVRDHEDILSALGSGDLGSACMALRQNMESGKAPIVSWLQGRAQQSGRETRETEG